MSCFPCCGQRATASKQRAADVQPVPESFMPGDPDRHSEWQAMTSKARASFLRQAHEAAAAKAASDAAARAPMRPPPPAPTNQAAAAPSPAGPPGVAAPERTALNDLQHLLTLKGVKDVIDANSAWKQAVNNAISLESDLAAANCLVRFGITRETPRDWFHASFCAAVNNVDNAVCGGAGPPAAVAAPQAAPAPQARARPMATAGRVGAALLVTGAARRRFRR